MKRFLVLLSILLCGPVISASAQETDPNGDPYLRDTVSDPYDGSYPGPCTAVHGTQTGMVMSGKLIEISYIIYRNQNRLMWFRDDIATLLEEGRITGDDIEGWIARDIAVFEGYIDAFSRHLTMTEKVVTGRGVVRYWWQKFSRLFRTGSVYDYRTREDIPMSLTFGRKVLLRHLEGVDYSFPEMELKLHHFAEEFLRVRFDTLKPDDREIIRQNFDAVVEVHLNFRSELAELKEFLRQSLL